MLDLRSKVQDSPEALFCVLEQDTSNFIFCVVLIEPRKTGNHPVKTEKVLTMT